MKKYNFLVTVILVCNLFYNCEDYLENTPPFEGLQSEDVFKDIRTARFFLNSAYARLITEVSAINNGSDPLSDMILGAEGHPGRLDSEVPETYGLYAQGDYLSLMNRNGGNAPAFAIRYIESWKAIRTCNTFLENVDLIQNGSPEQINRMQGEAYMIRAFCYHLMTKRHGGLRYFKENISISSPLDLERESYESNLADMIEDIDLAIGLLPIQWETENVGRLTRGAAMALKSRVTLFAASPLVNTSNGQAAWENAAKAASDLINFANTNGLYTLINASGANNMDVGHNGADLFVSEPNALKPYRNIFVGAGVSKVIPQEVIHMEANLNFDLAGGGMLNPVPRLALTVGHDILKGNTEPQAIGAIVNFVDKFETKNGLAIEDDPSYNPQEPFINRDPRFYNNILFDGVPWVFTTNGPLNKTGVVDLAQVNESGKLGSSLHDPATPAAGLWQVSNLTGYMIRKWIPNGAFWRNGNNGSWDYYVNNIIFRMPEVYLNYAEAVNEAYGPNGTAPGSSLTALQAVNIIRNRVGMPNVNAMYAGSKELLRERIRNERAIELAFEGIRFDDIRRWKTAHLDENTKVEFLDMRWQGGATATYPTGFSFNAVEQPNLKKGFTDKNYWWPVPSSETEAAPSFNQTPGW